MKVGRLWPWVSILMTGIPLYRRIQTPSLHNFMMANHPLTLSHHHLPPPLPSQVLCVLENSSTTILLQSEDDRTRLPTLPQQLLSHYRKAVFNVFTRVCSGNWGKIFFFLEKVVVNNSVTYYKTPLLWSKINRVFLCGQHSSLYTHLSQHLNFLQELWSCHIQCYIQCT